MANATVKMSLHLSTETNEMVEALCKDNHLTKSDLMRRAVALIAVALNYKKKGGHLVVLDDNDKKMSEIVGL